ncbi:manganese tolerance protein 2 [Basidiobolus meristosporus CBS 931.73]|uniref:Manganese tolerance protein 2 n=1 Tax=Basidiobolus meristosporus CBS 931.73 TaxID=1314790 RepID=A0A1Y1XCF5_9FUNG|nr:manganese tolerance protein 2 [Basidiobolus meristosporus CBS 931.73]|eukprot:ORX83403.1 manganese tolerance protein 2 [Basidiobolus meristosporus CBS 931.73]
MILAHHGPFDTDSLGTDDPTEETPLKLISNQRKTSEHLIRLAINISFVFNLVLFIVKVYTAIASGSLVVIASTIDSFMDLLSGAIIFYTATVIRHVNYYHYPIGKSRMEPLGIIVFSAVMITCFFQVMVTSFENLLNPEAPETLVLSPLTIMLLFSNIVVKFFLWLWCRTMTSNSVQALAQDHMNDVVFNVFSTILPVVAKSLNCYWVDPCGAICLSIYIIIDWIRTCTENIRRMSGASASAEDIQQFTYLTYRFSDKIIEIDTVRAYYVGDRLFTEIDIVLPPDCPLSEAHDIGEGLQNALEKMDIVERAFVHLDYNSDHKIEHRQALL